MKDPRLQPRYSTSHALVIGINHFQKAPPLNFAISDAVAMKELLSAHFDFSHDKIVALTDGEATRQNIMSAYMAFSDNGTERNDRLLVFYAGHGLTRPGSRGDIGFLFPHDGDPNDLSTLIRWDEFTYNAELIQAKHILFIMDACYGGLALSRSVSAGSVRFLKDMLLRPVRQVLTAGKADEIVADSGGPRPDHSVFTGHLLDALEGQAATDDGIITANGVMSYVYDKVSKDIHSKQTPHFGFFDGDGDFVFKAPSLALLTDDDTVDKDILIVVPSVEISQNGPEKALINQAKEYLSDSQASIKLSDIVMLHARKYLVESSPERFPSHGSSFSIEELGKRMEKYEMIIRELKLLAISISHWGQQSHLTTLERMISRATDNLLPESGLVVWSALRWYPSMILAYSAGIAALAARRFDSLYKLFTTSASEVDARNRRCELIWSLGNAVMELERLEVFKHIPGHERNYVPRSEYLFKLLQPDLDDLLFLGRDYEPLFDEYEVMMALCYADISIERNMGVWGPIGRFGWKYKNRSGIENPLSQVIETAKREGASWGPFTAGFFGGDINRFNKVATEYEGIIKKLNWL